MTEYDLFEDVLVNIKFGKLSRTEEHDELRRVIRYWLGGCGRMLDDRVSPADTADAVSAAKRGV